MYLYLDIDGVLNTNETVLKAYGESKLEGFRRNVSTYDVTSIRSLYVLACERDIP